MADEGLSHGSAEAKRLGNGPLLAAVVVSADGRLDGAPQIVVLGLAPWTTCLDQRCKHPPLRIRQNLHLASHVPIASRWEAIALANRLDPSRQAFL